jgi:Pyruvate/2-oxoacid:ferredoxin oxidoreductase gamma subunit
MEKALVISGVGGQGIQVTGTTLGWAAVHEGKRALYFSMFDGAQRGGSCASRSG